MRHLKYLAVALVASFSMVAGAHAQCAGDINNDDIVDIQDLLQFLGDWGCTGCAADINADGVADIQDLLMLLGDWGCQGQEPSATLSGTITNLWTSDPVIGASVQVGDDIVFTDNLGQYTGEFPVGMYDVVFEAEYFLTQTVPVTLVEDTPVTLDVQLMPVAEVIVNVVPQDDGAPGGLVDVLAEVIVLDGSAIQSYAWMQTGGAPAALANTDTDVVTATLGTAMEYKLALIDEMSRAPIADADLPDYVPPFNGAYHGGLQARFEIVAPNFFALEHAGAVHLSVDVTTSSGTYTGEGELVTHLPWRPATGLRNVPVDVPVLLHGPDQASYNWSLSKPGNSSATLLDAASQFPEFVPDWPGIYEVTVTDLANAAPVTIKIYAGVWRGVITGEDVDGRPIADTDCTGCHANLGHDKFTPWAQTGHAEIFTNNLNNSAYYNPGCFSCHAVGYDPLANNNGFDDAYDFQAFMSSGLLGNPNPANWSTMLVDFPWSAQLANAQCENCHGPQWSFAGSNTLAHGSALPAGEPRVDIAPGVCATCHGETPRHARFQQWQLSGHANYELAMDEGDSGNCSRCHTGNGFLTWLPILLGDQPGNPLNNITVSWTPDQVHPQTCATCHDPHASGNASGEPNNATVRISGDTPPLIGGFTATDVGRGAICMTCHNSRRGARNDSTFDQYFGTSEAARAPHGSAQSDVLMGENAYLVTVGIRGSHSFTEDTCATCHMVETPPPAALSYNQSGTNHTFFADREICANCHGPGINADFVQNTTQTQLDTLGNLIEAALVDLMDQQIQLGNTIDLNGDRLVTDVAEIAEVVFGEFRGRQSMTLTFTDTTTLGPYRMTDVDVRNPSNVIIGQLYDFADPVLIKSGWNWGLIHNDGSLGVHNFNYASNVLSTSINALSGP